LELEELYGIVFCTHSEPQLPTGRVRLNKNEEPPFDPDPLALCFY